MTTAVSPTAAPAAATPSDASAADTSAADQQALQDAFAQTLGGLMVTMLEPTLQDTIDELNKPEGDPDDAV